MSLLWFQSESIGERSKRHTQTKRDVVMSMVMIGAKIPPSWKELIQKLAREKGLFVGISSGANVLASLKIARKMPNKNIVTILPDSGDRYLSI